MSDSTATGAAAAPTPVASTDDFLSKEALTSGARFKRVDGELAIPELGGKLLLKAMSLKEERAITANLPDDPRKFTLKHTAFSLSRYVKTPVLTQDEWTAVLSKDDFPATAMRRINKKMAEIMDITEPEETAVADEFPGAED